MGEFSDVWSLYTQVNMLMQMEKADAQSTECHS